MTNTAETILQHLPELKLSRLGDDTPAGLWMTSLPWPRAARPALALNASPTYTQPLGQWPGEAEGTPRRLLLIGDGANTAPDKLSLAKTPELVAPVQGFSAEMECFESSPHPAYIWERHLLKLRYGSESIGMAMGMRVGEEIHWWEACRLVVLESTSECLVVEMGGAIPHQIMPYEALHQYPGYSNPFIHKHNWLNGRIYARLFANGVCEIYAHHINSRYVDNGLELSDAVPVIGFQTDAGAEELGAWDGTRSQLQFGGARLDVSEVARFATPEKPGSVERSGEFVVWQPYEGMELYGGLCPAQLADDPFVFRSRDKVIPRGMARTLRFSLSLSDRSPRIARYVAPAWWYGVCEEFSPESLLPVSNEYDGDVDRAAKWIEDYVVRQGFEDGSIPRNTMPFNHPLADGNHEPGWEGEVAYAQFLYAWRTGKSEHYESALRSAYFMTDVIVDHATKAVRMHGYPPPALSLPMHRMQAAIAGYLETGDPYLLETAQAVTANAHWLHKNSWPRHAVGRDACYVRSAVLLYRYFGDDFCRKIALEGALAVAEVQRENGSFGDQGGGTGLHQWGGYITKPWMGLLALGGVLDYLELFPNEPVLLNCVRRFGDWLMAERFDHQGIVTWSYQHDYNGGRHYYDPTAAITRVLPGEAPWHHDTLARLLGYCALRFESPDYLDAWMQSFRQKQELADHAVSASLQFVPWVQDHLWSARLMPEGMTLSPYYAGSLTPNEAVIVGPFGDKRVHARIDDPEPLLQEIWPKVNSQVKIQVNGRE